ncbi:hypothetical protein [Bradyrhizobium sp. Leo170]|uniref:hypothetical protein n=1 Tax=Bradyrhizobium sp. Leo170 TaxID=1571199 RepID=UPI00102E564E|nr:hypothetical protein [Bradyrhizobium sp. Leo170]TAI67612.1 hypothetical protein CWO89_02000 [Bradyrhizobium sp. Leo170]
MNLTAEIIRLAHHLMGGSRKNLAHGARCSIRTIDNWKSGARAIAFEEFFHLLAEPEGAEFFEAFWKQVPERTRERWIKGEILRRRLAEREAARAAEDREVEQLRMELNAKR